MNFEEYMSLPWNLKLEEFMNNLSSTNRTPQYYVNWSKVNINTKKYELELNTLNYLVGKQDIKSKALDLFNQQPNLLRVIPTLIAIRDYNLDILILNKDKTMSFDNLNFDEIQTSRISDYVNFIEDTGLLNFLAHDAKKSLVDYAFGVEVGLDSNGRKNRSGTQNEEILHITLTELVTNTNLEFDTQIGVNEIMRRWNVNVPIDKSSRKFDGAVYNPDTKKVTLIETNFYGGGGSKLKSVAGEFRDLNNFVQKEDVQFVWISDGMGWHTARLPMSESFEKIPYIINLNMVKNGYLKEIVMN